MMLMDILDGSDHSPKRGDLVQVRLKDRRAMRTYLVLRSCEIRRKVKGQLPRYKLWAVRWWELEPEMRLRLFASAERRGGQSEWFFSRYPAKKKRTFEQYMRQSNS
jgi:hypothetical protein